MSNTATQTVTTDPGIKYGRDGYKSTRTVTADEVTTAITREGRNNGPVMLVGLFTGGTLPDEVLAQTLGYSWSLAEYPEQYLDAKFWTLLFRRIGLRDQDGEHVERPDSLKVFRAADQDEGTAFPYGMAWTTDLDSAKWFAQRFPDWQGRPKAIHTVEVPGSVLLADLRGGSRNESEVVVDTSSAEFPTDDVTVISEP